MSSRILWPVVVCAAIGLAIAALGHHAFALGWLLVSTMALLSLADDGKPGTKTWVTNSLGAVGLFVFAARFGITPSEGGNIFETLLRLAETIHLDIFVFLAGLYLVVNTFSYSGFIGDLAWKIVKRAGG